MRQTLTVLVALLATAAAHVARAAPIVPAGFTTSTFVAPGASLSATGIAWAPDGTNRLFLASKEGLVRIVKNGTLLATPFATVTPVFTNSECGLIGIALDPSFAATGFVYLFVTVSASEQQIIRYTASGDVGTNKAVIVPGLPTVGANHDGGSIGFGPDGKLYWGIGDNGNGSGVNADLTSLAAKLGRANRDGSLPAGNPFADGAGPNNDYIWARGLRNPFALAFQPGTGALWVDVAGTNYEQIFVVTAGSHAGYNAYENNQPVGFIAPAVVYRTNTTDSRTLAPATGAVRSGGIVTFTTLAAHGFRKGSNITRAGVSDASFNGSGYVLSTPSDTSFTIAQAGPNATAGGGTATTLNIGGAVTGGDFWSTSVLPAAFRGNYFFGDYNSGRVERVTLAADNTVASVDHFASGFSAPIDAAVGPDGALYWLEYFGTVTRVTYAPTAQGLVVTPLQLRMDENSQAFLSVHLATAPSSTVTVAAGMSGSPDVSVVGGGMLSFTSANWATPQTVVLQAAQDSDAVEDVATVSLSAASFSTESVGVKVTELVGSGSGPSSVAVAATTPRHVSLLALLSGCAGFSLLRRRGEARQGNVTTTRPSVAEALPRIARARPAP